MLDRPVYLLAYRVDPDAVRLYDGRVGPDDLTGHDRQLRAAVRGRADPPYTLVTLSRVSFDTRRVMTQAVTRDLYEGARIAGWRAALERGYRVVPESEVRGLDRVAKGPG